MRVLKRIKRRWRWLAAFILLWLALLAADRLWPLPLHEVTPARVVVAEDGTPLWRFADAQGVWRYPVTLADVSPRYLQALIQYEDRWFWDHPGVNPLDRSRRLAGSHFRAGDLRGSPPCRWRACSIRIPHLWRQAAPAMALQLEWHLSKSEILTLYLNRAPFGGTLQGIGAASWAYLGKPPAQLSYGEAALLAVLPQAPSRLRPDRWPSGRRRRAIKCCCGWKARASGRAAGTRSDRRARLAVSAADAAAGAAFCPPRAGEQPRREGGHDAGCRTPAAAGRSGAELEIAPAAAQLAGDDRGRPYQYESARLGRVGGYQR
jgi:membrane carboxypeptidase/penicillin-binding protein PbpC